jgi:tetratricopeptide (TPR) repeat protein
MATIRWRFACGIMLLAGSMVSTIAGRSSADDPPATAIDKRFEPLRKALGETATAVEAADGLDMKVNTLLEVAQAQVRIGDREGAKANASKASETAKLIDAADDRWHFLLATAKSLSDSGNREAARADVKQALEEIMAFEMPESLYSALESVVSTAVYIDDLDGALKAVKILDDKLSAIEDESDRTQAMKSVISSRCHAGDFTGAYNALMGNTLRVIGFFPPPVIIRSQSLVSLLIGMESNSFRRLSGIESVKKREDDRRQTLERVTEHIKLLEIHDNKVDRHLINTLCAVGDPDEASKVLSRIKGRPPVPPDAAEAFLVPRSLSTIGRAQFRAGRLEEAHATLREARTLTVDIPATPENRKDLCLWSIASNQAEMGDTAEALQTIEKEPNDLMLALVRENIGKSLANQGDLEGAKNLWRRALLDAEEGLRNPKPLVPPDAYLSRIASIRARLGDFKSANEAFEKMLNPASAAFRIAEIRSRSGDIAGATAWASALADPYLRATALSGVAEGAAAKPR